MLDAPDPVESEVVGQPGLFQSVVVHLTLDAGAERPRGRQLEKNPEAHRPCVAPNALRRRLEGDVLDVEIFLDALAASFPPEPGLLDPTERRSRV